MKTTECICAECGGQFDKPSSEFNRSEKRGRRHFCSTGCSAAGGNHDVGRPRIPPEPRPQIDVYTNFRYFFRTLSSRCSPNSFNVRAGKQSYKRLEVTLIDLKEQWDLQKGVCPITGQHLLLPNGKGFCGSKSMWNASIDRIDNDFGYVKGNIRFVAVIANVARGRYTDSELLDFCRSVVDHHH
jgi:hypothetical protein